MKNITIVLALGPELLLLRIIEGFRGTDNEDNNHSTIASPQSYTSFQQNAVMLHMADRTDDIDQRIEVSACEENLQPYTIEIQG